MKGVGFNEYCAVLPPPAQVYSPLKKDLSWMGLPEFVDDTATDYTRPTPSIDVSKSVKHMIKFVKESGCPTATKVNNTKNARKSTVKYAEMYRNTSQSPRAKNKVWSPTVRPKIPIVGSKVPTAKPAVAVDKGNKGKAVKASARWIWKPKQTSSDQGLNFNGVLVTFKKYQYIDTKGRLKSNLVKGLPSKSFENDHSCVACLKGKHHKASFVTDDFSRFSWTFFLKYKDETSRILRNFITETENLKDLKVKIIKSDNGGEFMNKEMDEFCSRKGIKREFSNARTPQQNGVAERRNQTLIEAARTMLADAKLLVTFWAEAINTACYVQNRVLVTKPYNKIPYELFNERSPAIGFLRPFGCHVMILNTLEHLGKFDKEMRVTL
nr:hypothetical protein [Tanacetum cinerariifolium]